MRKKYHIALLLAAITLLTACGNEDKFVDPTLDGEVTVELMEKNEFPGWLRDYIDYLEQSPEGQRIAASLGDKKAAIYRFEWNDERYYEVVTPSQSKMHQDMYTANGTPIELTEEYYQSFTERARNWTVVYVIQPSTPQNRQYPVDIQDTTITHFFDSHQFQHYVSTSLPTGCHTIHSRKELNLLFKESGFKLPTIDFDKYTLVLGNVLIPKEALLKRQEMDDRQILNIYFEKAQKVDKANMPQLNYALNPLGYKTFYFWSLYNSISPDTAIIYRIQYNNKGRENGVCSTPKAPIPDIEDYMEKIPLNHTWYLDNFTTADGVRHQVSKGYGNKSYYFKIPYVAIDEEYDVLKSRLYFQIDRNIFQINLDITSVDTPTEDSHPIEGKIAFKESQDVSYYEYEKGNNYTVDYIRQNLKRAKRFACTDSLHLSLILSDTERMEFCREEVYPTGEEYDILEDINNFITSNTVQHYTSDQISDILCGYGWEIEAIHEFNYDGTYAKNSYSSYSFTGIHGVYFYEFLKATDSPTTVRLYFMGMPYWGYRDSQYLYEASNADGGNHTNVLTLTPSTDDTVDYIILSADDNEIRAVKRGGIVWGQHYYEIKDYLYIVLKRMTDERLSIIKENAFKIN